MELSVLISFLLTSLVLTIMPGPDNIFVLTESLTKGKHNGILISAGLSLGVLVHTALVATGLSVFIQKTPSIFLFIKYLGVVYLFYLIYQTYKEKTENPLSIGITEHKPSNEKALQLIKKGFFMNVLNPKVTLFFIVFLPQFIIKNGFNFSIQIFILGIVFLIQSFIVFSAIATLTNKLSNYLQGNVFWKNVKWIKISVLFAITLFLVFSN